MTDDSQPPSYGPPPGQGPYQGQPPQYGPPPPQYGPPQYGQQQGPPQYGQQPYQTGPYGQPQPYQPGPYGTPQRFGPQVDPKLIRPRLRSIAVAWGLALLACLAGVGLFVSGILNTVGAVAPSKTFAAGQTVTVPLDPADKPVVYLASASQVHYMCRIDGGPGQAKLAKTSGIERVTVNGTQWQLVLVVNAPVKGDYQFTCTTQEQVNARFGVGRDFAAAAGAAGGLVGGVVALLVIPGLGVLAAVIVTIMVVTRRSAHRKRLAAGG
ncbi:hypothetical protein ACQP2T_45545 [Nonomuraea sp. CA-143628]|uniref:hypothetical protein n=1 Tax=Nonomuraea sp. CA-143628 TaxID=3239997 RepID=UPI003D93B2F2